MTKSAASAACKRRSITAQGFRLSDNEMAQKSPPSGAPTRAAAASIAVMPGSTVIGTARQAGSPSSASNTAAAMAKTPGSPPDTTATRFPCAARSSAKRGALQLDPVVGGMAALARLGRDAVEIGAVADEIGRVAPAPAAPPG